MRVAVVTSGGDAPGMNACVRAVVKGASNELQVVGVRQGGLGLLRNRVTGPADENDYFDLAATDVRCDLTRRAFACNDDLGALLIVDVLRGVGPALGSSILMVQ